MCILVERHLTKVCKATCASLFLFCVFNQRQATAHKAALPHPQRMEHIKHHSIPARKTKPQDGAGFYFQDNQTVVRLLLVLDQAPVVLRRALLPPTHLQQHPEQPLFRGSSGSGY